ncbi:uncharacterized protein LOC126693473 [Quercus robur]|uniref:uncharacterized protein LOC126693473 n=1 Tax=Quercus robur TaxID=38942 RepID=UPI0021630915|nr:uncharacterized protein LOC126693473 [Quercus robur]
MVRKSRAHKKISTSSTPVFQNDRFLSPKNQETFEKLNIYKKVWAERKMILDEFDPKIRRSFDCRSWLPLLDVDHPPQTVLIKEFYLNLSVHSTSSNIQFMKSWIRGEEYVITPQVVASALGVPLVLQPVYPYDETPPLDDIMSLIIGTTIQWGTDPRIISYELTELNFFRISCHSIWPISHLHTIPIERCAFLYALVTDDSICFPSLFISTLVEVYRSSLKRHGLFFSIFIHRILLDLGLEDFPASEPVHIITAIGTTFLKQRAAQMKASSKRPKVESSTGDDFRPPPSSDPSAEEMLIPLPQLILHILLQVMLPFGVCWNLS